MLKSTAPSLPEIPQAWDLELGPSGFAGRLARNKTRQLVRRHKITAAEADDFLQQLLLHIWKKHQVFQNSKAPWYKFVTLVIRRNICLYLRDHKQPVQSSLEQPLSLSSLRVNEFGEREELVDSIRADQRLTHRQIESRDQSQFIDDEYGLAKFVTRLPAHLQQIVPLLGVVELKNISRRLGISLSTLKRNMLALRERTQKYLEEQNISGILGLSPSKSE